MTEALFEKLAAPMAADDLRLRALAPGDEPELARAFAADGDLFAWMLVRQPSSDAETRAWLDAALASVAAREHAAFATELPDGTLAGTTRFLDVREFDRGVEIGWTMVFPQARGTWVNGRAKALMLARAFEVGFARVQLKTDARNLRSRAAIAAIGATFEGVLRNYQRRADGTIRDTAMFSILATDWPDVRRALEARTAHRKGHVS